MNPSPPPPPDRSSMGRAGRRDPRLGGAPWWAYERPPGPQPFTRPPPPTASAPSNGTPAVEPATGPPPASSDTTQGFTATLPTGQPQAVAVVALIATSIIATRVFNIQAAGAWLLPIAGVVAAVGFGNRCRRVHPDEPWLPRLLLIGTLAKIGASFARYVTLTTAYENAGDATTWDIFARKLIEGWEGLRPTPNLPNLQQSNFMKWITGVTYYLFGESLVGAFLIFGLLAVVGSYCWYRALSDAVPFVNKKLFLIFMMFAPSILFWPSSLGKEALMQLGVGAVAWATSLALNGRFIRGIPLMLSGGWLLFIVRPHLLALVTLAAAVPYFIGRVGAGQRGSVLSRPIGMIAIAILVVFTVTSGAKFLGLQNLSVESVQTELDSTTASTSQGGSKFSHGSNSLSPIALPNDVATVLFRPFIFEAHSGLLLLAALEGTALIGIVVVRWESIRIGFARCRRWPFLLYLWILLMLYCLFFSAFANFGLLTRERSLILPALYALICIDPALARRQDEIDHAEQAAAVDES